MALSSIVRPLGPPVTATRPLKYLNQRFGRSHRVRGVPLISSLKFPDGGAADGSTAGCNSFSRDGFSTKSFYAAPQLQQTRCLSLVRSLALGTGILSSTTLHSIWINLRRRKDRTLHKIRHLPSIYPYQERFRGSATDGKSWCACDIKTDCRPDFVFIEINHSPFLRDCPPYWHGWG